MVDLLCRERHARESISALVMYPIAKGLTPSQRQTYEIVVGVSSSLGVVVCRSLLEELKKPEGNKFKTVSTR